MGVRGERAVPYRTGEKKRGGGESGLTNREISKELASRIGRIISLAAGIKLAAGKTNALGISAGRDGSLQQDIEHDFIPLMSCPQSIGADSCEGAGCDLW
jgi:hypothetical protein